MSGNNHHCTLGLAYWAADKGNVLLTITSFLGAVLLIFFVNLDRIAEIKVSAKSFEAKTRDLIKRAEFTLSELQSLVLLTSETALTLSEAGSRFGGLTDDVKDRLAREVRNLLDRFKLKKSDIDQAFQVRNKYIEFDYQHLILSGRSQIPKNATVEQQRIWRDATKDLFDNPLLPHQVREVCIRLNALSPDVEERIKDYEYFIKHKEHRRPNEWKNRDKWEPLSCGNEPDKPMES